MKKVVEKRFGCVAFAAQILGDKWTPLIIKNLCEGRCRFSEMQQLNKINPRTLSAKLDFLEESQIITKIIHPEVPVRVEYSLTQKGQDLIPILRSMAAWGDKYSETNTSVGV
jgi:DNA-binding HxlR family transcriptional regulator